MTIYLTLGALSHFAVVLVVTVVFGSDWREMEDRGRWLYLAVLGWYLAMGMASAAFIERSLR